MRSRRRAVAVLAAVFVVGGAATARADDGDLYVEGCVARTAIAGCPAGLPGLPIGVGQSPDGRHLYVGMTASGAGSYNGLKIFDRDPQTGLATPRSGVASCFAASNSGAACTPAAGTTSYADPFDVEVTPDGRSVYLVTFSGSLLNFARDPISGNLSYVNCVGNGAACTDLATNAGALSVAVSPTDSSHVYVKTTTGLAVLDRDANLAVAQKPSFDGCFTEGSVLGCDEVDGINGESYGMEISPDGRQLYVAFRSPGGIGIFNRAPDGKLSQPNGQAGGCISANGNSAEATRCKDGNDFLSNTYVTAISPDGASVYAGTEYGIVAYSRDAGTGYLTEVACYVADVRCVRPAPSLSRIFGLAVTPDGGELVASGIGTRTVMSFRRDAGTGALTQRAGTRGCAANPAGTCLALAILHPDHHSRIAMDPSGLRFYVTSRLGMLATITRDYVPICTSSTVDAPYNTAIEVPLSCTDANDDPMTLEKGTLPARGQLGELTAQRTVFYSPFANYVGPDSFAYRASTPNRGVAGPYATVSVNVAGPPAPPAAPQPGGIDSDRDGFFAGQDCNDTNAAIRPGAQEIRGNRTDENCDGTADAFPTLTSGVASKWDVKGSRLTLTALQATQQFPKGWKAVIKCSGKPKCTFASKTLKAGKVSRGAATIISSLSRRQRVFRAGQTVEVWVSAPNFNTKVARLVLRKGRIPTTQPFCVLPGSTRVQKTCT